MNRNRSSAKKAGTDWENAIVDALNDAGYHVERRARNGAKDRGDIAGLPIVIEAKNVKAMDLAGWVAEANVEALNADVGIGVVWHKRHGRKTAAEGYVTMDGVAFLNLLSAWKALFPDRF